MPIEFYSPVSGGAIATVIMQATRGLLGSGNSVSVLTTIDANPTYSFGTVIEIEYVPRSKLSRFHRLISRLVGKVRGFDWPRFDYYLRSYIAALTRAKDPPDVVVLFNDLASSEYVRRAFPCARILVWLHNECRTRHNMRRTISCTDLFVANSAYIRDWTIAAHGIPMKQFVVVHNGVDLDAFRPRKEFLLKRDLLRVLFIGRIDPNKGPDIAAGAVATLQREGYDVTLTVVGGLWFYGDAKPSENPFFQILKRMMDEVNAKYLGHVNRAGVPDVVREHDVVCVLSRSNEPFGLVVLEAMASGCAVIASKRGGLPEACGNAALLVDETDPVAVSDALRALVVDIEKLKYYKLKSIVRASLQPWAKCASAFESAVQSL